MLQDIFFPSRRNLLVWGIILFIFSPFLIGIWQREVQLGSVDWPAWRNIAMSLFWSLNIIGSLLQAPYFLVSQFFPSPNNYLLANVITSLGLIIIAYFVSSLVATIWEAYKMKVFSKKDLLLYISLWSLYLLGSFIGFFLISFYGITDLIYFLIFIGVAIGAIAVTWRFKKYLKKTFIPLVVLTAFLLLGSLGQTLEVFEENYCWNMGTKAEVRVTNSGGNSIGVGHNVHTQCHQTFNLITALKETLTK